MKHFNSPLPGSLLPCILLFISSCQQSGSAFQERIKKQTVDANDELLNKGNLSVADEIFTAEYAGSGPEGIKNFVQQYRNAFPNLQVTVDPIIAEGNMVGWRRTLTGTFTNAFNGIQPTGRKITWHDYVLSRMNDDAKIAEEWGTSDLTNVLMNENIIDGVFEYLPPDKGQSINRNGRYTYLYGPADGSGPMISQAGAYRISGDTVTNTINYSTDNSLIGQSFRWTITAASGDTISYNVINMDGKVYDSGRAVRVSK